MSYNLYNPDEYEAKHNIVHHAPGCSSGSVIYVRRSPEDVAKIKAMRRDQEEAEILRRADEIRARRAVA